MDEESSTKFIGSLTKFLQSFCNRYVEFEDSVELIGHIYLSVDAGKTGKKLNYFLNEKVCKKDNSVTFISNSFHAQPEPKEKGVLGKDGEGKKDDVPDAGESVPKSTNSGTVPSRSQMSSKSAPSPNQSRSCLQIGTKRSGSPLSAPTAPSKRRMQSAVRSSVGSPVSRTVPSSQSSSSQDNIPSPSSARKNRKKVSQPPSNQSNNASVDNESDIVPTNIMTIKPLPDYARFIGSLTSDNQTSRDQRSPPDTKPDTDVTLIKEEFVSEHSSCAQTGSSGQSGRSGDDLYPVMLRQNQPVFASTGSSYHSATATSQHPGYPAASTSQSGADPSAIGGNSTTSTTSTSIMKRKPAGLQPLTAGKMKRTAPMSSTQAAIMKVHSPELTLRNEQPVIQCGSWVEKTYLTKRGQQQLYRGQVISFDSVKRKGTVKFLRQTGQYFTFPPVEDLDMNVPDTELTLIPPPMMDSRQHYYFK